MKRGVPAAVLMLISSAVLGLVSCAAPPTQDVVRVPEEAATISEAMELVAEGGLVLVAPGTYHEEVLIKKNGVTLRGEDRNEVIIDGEGRRPYGVVGVASGITVENLTVTRATFYGVLVTGMFTEEGGPSARENAGYTTLDPEEFPPLQRFLVDHVTATNNGLYGIYAFNAQNGVIRDSYASGSADSGIYVGQCRECGILVEGNTAENNAVGFENANASDSVWIVSNDFSRNRIGMTFLSNYQEAFAPQEANWIAGNTISDNISDRSPSHAQGGWGIGVGLSGASENVFERNVITGNPVAGISLSSAEDIASSDNRFTANNFEENGVDLLNASSRRAAAHGNCVDGEVTTLPAALLLDCSRAQPSTEGEESRPEPPPGMSYLEVPLPPEQESLRATDSVPPALPNTVDRPRLASI